MEKHPTETYQGYKTPAYYCPQDVVVGDKLSHRWGVTVIGFYKSTADFKGHKIKVAKSS